ncbi:MAG: glycosyl hydrolase 53 family protein, partial [Bacilli bacterium]|nr:glycosyl hydrolase 53 family protein [Bacilli bacterium]
TSGSANMVTYLTAASEGVDLVDSSIKKVIHWAKGSTFTAGTINSFYSALSSVDYDYAGLSIYPYYCCPTGNTAVGGGIDTLNSVLSGLSLSKPWFVAETSYPFTGSSYVYENATEVTNFAISDWTVDGTGQGEVKDITTMKANYPFTPAGQAKMIHDLTYSIVRYGGLGVFYWEGAWVPNANVGWAGSGSSCSWSNQGFFSYDGKPIANLNLFAQLSPYID